MVSRTRNSRRAVLWLMFGLGLLLVSPARSSALDEQAREAGRLGNYQKQYRELTERYAERLTQIAKTAEAGGFAEEAKDIRALAVPLDGAKIQAGSLPRNVQPDLPVTLPREESWRLELRKVRQDHAAELYRLSRALLHERFPSQAYRLVREVVIADPDHTYARKILGFQRSGDEWITPFEAKQSRDRMVWHEKFGWLLKTYVDRYDRGQRYYAGQWMPAEKEAEIRQDFRHAWEVRTEHFLVKANVSLEKGVEIAKKLEEYHDFFVQTFPGFFHTPEQLQKLFTSASLPGRSRAGNPFVVHYYRTREEYVRSLVQDIPQIGITNGLYHNGHRVAYFYDNPEESNDSTLYHEATHQLLYETRFPDRQTAQMVGDDANFWIIEGIACYMESLKQTGGQKSLGDPEFIRFYWARNRFLSENYYVPLARLAAMGQNQFQHQPTEEMSRNYSQSSGLVHFFMHYKDGLYRDAMIEHLSQIYRPGRRIQPVATLAELTGVPFAELDKQYGEYLRAQQKAVNARQPLTPAGP